MMLYFNYLGLTISFLVLHCQASSKYNSSQSNLKYLKTNIPVVLNTAKGSKSTITKLQRLEEWAPKLIWPRIDLFHIVSLPIVVSYGCESSLHNFTNDLKARRKSLLRVLDASSKFRPDFIGKGQMADFGFIEQCSKTSHRQCLVEIEWPLNVLGDQPDQVKLHLNGTWLDNVNKLSKVFHYERPAIAVCFPVECSNHDLEHVGHYFANLSRLPIRFHLKCSDAINGIEHEMPIFRIYSTAILIVVALVAVSSTVLRASAYNSNAILTCFDIRDNSAKLLHQTTVKQIRNYHF